MSVVHDNLQRRDSPVRMWYLKGADGNVYGPVQLSVLTEWAAQSRVVPGNEVSEDKKKWVPVEDLPELKMEWVADLSEGRSYGPFNVLAVPYLYNSGVLPAGAQIVNRKTGKVLQVHDLIKTAAAVPAAADGKTVPSPTSGQAQAQIQTQERKWEDRFHDEKRTRLLHEGQLQQTIDRLMSEAKAAAKALEESRRRAEDEGNGRQQLELKCQEAERRLKESNQRFESDLRQVETHLQSARKELADEKRRVEEIQHASGGTEERLSRELERMKTEVGAAQKALAEERERVEEARRQGQVKERELSQALEEARRQLETQAGRLEKTGQELQVVESGKAESLVRAREEESRLRGRMEKAEKELAAASRELAEQRKRGQLMEKESAQKESRFQVQAADFKRKTDALHEEIERHKKEAERAKSLHAELEKAAAEKESALRKDALYARGEVTKTEHELAALKKQYDALKEQGVGRVNELNQSLGEMTRRVQVLEEERGGLSRLAGEREEQGRETADRLARAEAGAEKARATVEELRLRCAGFETELQRRRDEHEALSEDFVQARREHAEARVAADKALAVASRERDDSLAKAKELAKALDAERAAAEALRQQEGAVETQVSQVGTELRQTKKALEEVRADAARMAAAAADREKSLAARVADMEASERDIAQRLQESQERGAQLAVQLEDTRRSLITRAAILEKSAVDQHALLERAQGDLAELQQQLRQRESDLARRDQEDGQRQREVSDLQKALTQARELQAEAERKVEEEKNLFSGLRETEGRRESELTRERDAARAEAGTLKQALSESEERIKVLSAAAARAAELEPAVAAARQEAEAQRARIQEISKEQGADVEALRQKLRSAEEAAAFVARKVESETQKIDQVREKAREREEGLRRELDQARGESAAAVNTVKEIEKQLLTRAVEFQDFQKQMKQREKDLENARADLEKIHRQHGALTQVIQNQGRDRGAEETDAGGGAERPTAVPAASPLFTAGRLAAAILILLGVSTAAFMAGMRRSAPSQPAAASADRGKEADPPTPPVPPPPAPPATPAGSEPVSQDMIVWPRFEVDNVRAEYGEKGCTLVFAYGVFTTMTRLREEAADALGEIARQMKPHLKGLVLEIEGHCDSLPVSSTTSVGDNYKLGLARAEVVRDLLKTRYGISEESMRTTSTGEQNPPYSNEEEESRLKNRTVVLKLIPKK